MTIRAHSAIRKLATILVISLAALFLLNTSTRAQDGSNNRPPNIVIVFTDNKC